MVHRLHPPLLAALLLASACKEAPPPPASESTSAPEAAAPPASASADAASSTAACAPLPAQAGAAGAQVQRQPAPGTIPAGPPPPPPVLVRCVAEDGPLSQRNLAQLQELALEAESAGETARMLACAEEALRLAEDDATSAHLRAEALLQLGRLDEAAEAFTLTLALSPHDPLVLAGAAELYANHLPMRRDRTLTALAFAERGLLHAPRDEEKLLAQLHLLASWARSDLGYHREALVHAGVALHLDPESRDARVIRGRALFELTRFPEAARVLELSLEKHPDDAESHFLLGLALERIEGRVEEAEAHLAEATQLDPLAFPAPVTVDAEGIAALVRSEVAALPERERGLLRRGKVPVRVAALPDLADLRAEDPPLSPTAVGMFRGPPLGVARDEPREILLFARNLRRAARDMGELREQVRITLLHELGHLAGEDEAMLRARGLE